ncbi:MAG: sigma-70 family RNA polymerase sigma factor [Acidobacteria bacterium]|nr:sigma-70 family RNA polymerase sigma factor [Acidobacteriota bacterium]
MQETESAAVARARDGDGEAFRLLVERSSRSVFRLAFRLTGNEQDAEDVVQETFLRAYRQIGKYDGRASFHTWVYRIAANLALDLLRSRKRTTEPALETIRSDEMPADRAAYARQLQQHLARAMNDLSEQERTAFVLRHFEGLSIREIGGVLGVGESAAKHSIFRAVGKLRLALEPVMGVAR